MIADRRVMVEVARDLHTLFLCRGVLGVDITDYLISVVFNQFPVTWVVGVKFVGGCVDAVRTIACVITNDFKSFALADFAKFFSAHLFIHITFPNFLQYTPLPYSCRSGRNPCKSTQIYTDSNNANRPDTDRIS